MIHDIAHITERQRRTLQARLTQRARIVSRDIDHALHSGDLESEPFDPGSTTVAAVDAATIQRHHDELGRIDEALLRMKGGTYGTCVECGCSIPWVRLDAQPDASRCTHCKEDRERGEPKPPSL